MAKARKSVTPGEISTFLAAHRLTQAKAAELVSVTDRTFRRWISGRVPIPFAAWELLQIKGGKPKHLRGGRPPGDERSSASYMAGRRTGTAYRDDPDWGKPQSDDQEIPQGDYDDLRRRGYEPDKSSYWEGYNSALKRGGRPRKGER
jgi:hypothetical protein